MTEAVTIRQARMSDAAIVQEMLEEAARWVDALGVVMWDEGELAPGRVDGEIAAGQFIIAEASGDPAGAMKFQLEDRLFWPDLIDDDSAFIHRLVVRRRYKGSGVSTALIRWAVSRATILEKRYLRLDCDASRPKLRRLYEGLGFEFHSFRQVGAYYVARYQYPLVQQKPGSRDRWRRRFHVTRVDYNAARPKRARTRPWSESSTDAMPITREGLLEFMRSEKYAVQASVSRGGAPQAAVVGIVVSDRFEIVFDTVASSRKAANLRVNPAVALVIGGTRDGDERTVQYRRHGRRAERCGARTASRPLLCKVPRWTGASCVARPDLRAREADMDQIQRLRCTAAGDDGVRPPGVDPLKV